MTKKHFGVLAAALWSAKPIHHSKVKALDAHEAERRVTARLQWEHDVQCVTKACEQFNSNFDRERFLTACGVETKP